MHDRASRGETPRRCNLIGSDWLGLTVKSFNGMCRCSAAPCLPCPPPCRWCSTRAGRFCTGSAPCQPGGTPTLHPLMCASLPSSTGSPWRLSGSARCDLQLEPPLVNRCGDGLPVLSHHASLVLAACPHRWFMHAVQCWTKPVRFKGHQWALLPALISFSDSPWMKLPLRHSAAAAPDRLSKACVAVLLPGSRNRQQQCGRPRLPGHLRQRHDLCATQNQQRHDLGGAIILLSDHRQQCYRCR